MAKTQKIEEHLPSALATMVKDPFSPLYELITNGIDEGIVNVSLSDNLIRVMNTGKPVRSFKHMFKVGKAYDDTTPIDNNSNHLRCLGFKLPVAYYACQHATAVVYSRYKTHYKKAVINYVTRTYSVETINLDEHPWPYGEWTTVVEVPLEREIDFSDFTQQAGRKYACALNDGISIKWNDIPLVPIFHANPVNNHNHELEEFWINKDDVICMPKLKACGPNKEYVKAVLPCEPINGKVEVIWQKAPLHEGASSTSGVSIYNNGVLVDYPRLATVSQLGSYGKKGKFKPIDNNRYECNALATYVNLRPGKGVEMPFSGDKTAIDWENTQIGRDLRIFLDNTIGHKYRKDYRICGEQKDRRLQDAISERFFNARYSNSQFFKEVNVISNGKVVHISDGVVLRVTGANEDKVENYFHSKTKSPKKRYTLTADDFVSESTRKNPEPDVWIIEYKSLDHPSILQSDVDQLVGNIMAINAALDIETEKMRGLLFGSPSTPHIAAVIKKLEAKGITIECYQLAKH